MIQDLRAAGLAVEYSLTPAKPDKQFKRAQEIKAAFTVRLEVSGTGEPVCRVKSLQAREDHSVPVCEAAAFWRHHIG